MDENGIVNGNEMENGIAQTLVDKKGIKAYSRYGMGLLVYLLSMLVLPSIVLVILQQFMSAETLSKFSMLVTYVCMYAVGFPLLLLILRKVPKLKPTASEPKKMKIWQVIGLFFISYTLMNIVSMIVGAIEGFFGTKATITAADLAHSNPIVLFILGVVVAPIMEEIIFRKIGRDRVASYGGGLYIVYTAILFGLMHANLGQSIYAMGMGFILAKITYETGTVKYSMLIHVLCNLFAGVGIGSIVLRINNEMVTLVYSLVILLIMVLGVVSAIVFLVKYRGVLKNTRTITPMVNKKRAFLNPGTIIYIIIALAAIVAMFLV